MAANQTSLSAQPTFAPVKRMIEFEGRRLEFPSDATDAEIGGVLSQPSPSQSGSPTASAGGIVEVEAPDGTIVEFPSGTDRSVMADAVRKPFPAPVPAPMSDGGHGRMIEINAPDGSIIQFPEGTPDATIIDVMRKNYPPPASDLSSLGADANRELAQRHGGLDALNAADLAKLAPAPAAPPSFMDRLKSLVAPTPAPAAKSDVVEPSLISTIMDQGAYVPRGARRGLANIVGLPVDIVNAGLNMAGVPVSQKPVGGSKFLDEALGGFGLIPDVRKPATATERMLSRTGEEIGAAALPVGAAVRAGKMGVEAARELPILARMFVEPAAINPGKFAQKEMATAAAAGTGAAAAGEISHASGAKEGGAVHNTLDILGALTGAGVLGAGRIVGKPLGDIAKAVIPSQREKFSNRNVKETVVDRLANNAEILPKVEGKPIDTQPLVDAILGGNRVDGKIPGFKDSIADRTGDSGLASLEYGRQSGPNAGDFVQRRADNTMAVDSAINANAPNGTPAALRSELELERTRRLADAGVRTANATDDFERATQRLQPAMTGEGRGANIRSALEGASDQARDILQQAWEPLNNSAARVDTAPLARDFAGIRQGMSTAEAGRFRPDEAAIPQRLSGEREIAPAVTDTQGNVVTPPLTEPITQPIREITGLRSALTDASREAANAGRTNEARIINQHVDALDNYLDNAVPPDLRTQYDHARGATVDFHDRFTRPQTAVAQTLDRQQGQYRQPDSAVAGKFVQADEGKVADFQALMRETGHDDRTVSAVRDQILADVRDRGLLDRPDQLTDYLGRYNTVLSDPRFNGVRDQLNNAAGLRRSLDEATANETSLTRELGTPGRSGTSTVAKYLQYGDERAVEAMKGVMAARKPGEATDELLRFVNDAPQAVEGARKAFWDIMQQRARRGGETTATTDGVQPWMPKALKGFLDDPATSAVAERLYRDNPEHLANIRGISDALQGVDLRSRARASNTSGTAQGISNILTPETLQSRFYAYKRGQTSLSFMLTALGSVVARRAVRGAQSEAIEKLLDKALLDPELAAQLLKESNPANRAALARKAKAFLGNEASHLVDILDGDGQEKDLIKGAIMKGDK